MRVVVLGAGFGGLEVASRLADEGAGAIEVVLIDAAEGFVFGFSKLDVMFGRAPADHVLHRYSDMLRPGIRFVSSTIRAIDPVARLVTTDDGAFDADVLVVALGAEVEPSATPGLVEGGHEFYTVDGAFALSEVIGAFQGGQVVVGVTGTPFKCPPAPSEAALMMHETLMARGLADRSTVSLVMPFGTPIPPSPEASRVVLEALSTRGIGWHPGQLVRSLDPGRRVAVTSEGVEFPYDLFLGIPIHRAPQVVVESGLTVDGWVPVDATTLQTVHPGVYAVGDVTSIGTPKAGVFAERQAAVVADRILAAHRGVDSTAAYDGYGTCYLQFGDAVSKVEVTFVPGQPPTGSIIGPSPDLVDDKESFGTERIARWFGRGWTQLPS